jgi:Ni/Co efflux regulator RcnB
LAATALLPAAALAQTVSPPTPWEDTPQVRLNTPARAAQPVPAPVRKPLVRPSTPQRVAQSPRPIVQQAQPMQVDTRDYRSAAAAAPAYHRMERGGRVDGDWNDPRHELREWDRYDLYPPAEGRHWMRYHDDALLVDRSGRIEDGRYGLDWDEYDDDHGPHVPVYSGRGDYRPDARDYAWVEGDDRYADYEDEAPYYEEEDGRREERIERRYVSRGHHGGYRDDDYPPGTIITETTVTIAPTVTTHSYHADEAAPPPRKLKRVYKRKIVTRNLGERG